MTRWVSHRAQCRVLDKHKFVIPGQIHGLSSKNVMVISMQDPAFFTVVISLVSTLMGINKCEKIIG